MLAVITLPIQNLTDFHKKSHAAQAFLKGKSVLGEAHPTKAASRAWLNGNRRVMHPPWKMKPRALRRAALMTCCVHPKPPPLASWESGIESQQGHWRPHHRSEPQPAPRASEASSWLSSR